MRNHAPLLLLLVSTCASAGGGLVLRNDTCIMTIGFYEAHFTAYQPQSSGDEEFCENLPASGETVFVLDYLHRSLKDVPVDFRIIRNVSGKGEFARFEDVEAMADIDAHTLYYVAPVVKADGRFIAEYDFGDEGEYIGIVTAGHPSNGKTYTSVFPFAVGQTRFPWGWLGLAAAVIIGGGFLLTTLGSLQRGAESAG